MKRAIIITKGRVQRVGYRDLVADWAMDLDVVGFIENQPDGTVKIVAEGEEERLEEFIRKAQPEDDPLIRIAQVDVGYEKIIYIYGNLQCLTWLPQREYLYRRKFWEN